jgi:hypothetical protein
MIEALGFIFMVAIILGPTIFFAKLLSDVKRHDNLTAVLVKEREESDHSNQ